MLVRHKSTDLWKILYHQPHKRCHTPPLPLLELHAPHRTTYKMPPSLDLKRSRLSKLSTHFHAALEGFVKTTMCHHVRWISKVFALFGRFVAGCPGSIQKSSNGYCKNLHAPVKPSACGLHAPWRGCQWDVCTTHQMLLPFLLPHISLSMRHAS